MEDRRASSGSRLLSILFHIVADGVAISLIFLISLGVHELGKLVGPDQVTFLALWDRIERIAVMACITLFSVKVLAEISIEIYVSTKKSLSNASLRAKQFRWATANEVFSYIVGVVGFAVVYSLVHRADSVEDVAAKLMIYAAVLILFGEILYMVTSTVRDRVLPEVGAVAQIQL